MLYKITNVVLNGFERVTQKWMCQYNKRDACYLSKFAMSFPTSETFGTVDLLAAAAEVLASRSTATAFTLPE